MQCIQWGKWERPYESLPDAVKWPAFAPIRENMLEALQWVRSLSQLILLLLEIQQQCIGCLHLI
jgi:hypothetical protein